MNTAAFKANDSKSQLEYIEDIENQLIDDDNDIVDATFCENCFKILPKYLQNDDKAVRQRSLKILEHIGTKDFQIPEDTTTVCYSIILCLTDQRENIKSQALRTLTSLLSVIPAGFFIQQFDQFNNNFSSEIRNELISYINEKIDTLTINDWKSCMLLIATAVEDKVENTKLIAQVFSKNQDFTDALQQAFASLPSSQQKLLHQYIDASGIEVDKSKSMISEIVETPEATIAINSSAFSRKSRNEQMSEEDGLKLIHDSTAFAPFLASLSNDVRDVFDDDISKLLLSTLYVDRLSALESLRTAFKPPKKFQYTIDIMLKWCGIQFLMRQVSCAQAALGLLLDNLQEGIKVSKVELTFIVPIVLWCIATKSDAYSDLLDALKFSSKNSDYAYALLKSISLEHSAIITIIFEELGKLDDLTSVESQLKDLSHNRLKIISEPAKQLLFSIAPKGVDGDGNIDTSDPIAALQAQIERIRSIPEFIRNQREIFSFLFSLYEDQPTDERLVRYLLYCTYAFLSEPTLISAIENQSLVALFNSMLNFSLDIDQKFSEPMNAIGFILVTVVPVFSLYQSLIMFIDKQPERITRQTFVYNVFMTANSLFCLDRVGADLMMLRDYVKDAITRYGDVPKEDLRPVLYKSLLTETVTLDQQRRMTSEFFKQNQSVDQRIVGKVAMEEEYEEPPEMTVNDKLIFVKIVDKIGTMATKQEGIQELIQFDQENKCNNGAINAVCKLAPMLRTELSQYLSK
ncbi:hypothetical protein TVAG_062980 [Trichomonas vaginalis G3]|uniref:Uncharacterized protein n=1 Tax=Trichomonas vaginalis (strain ATCC PRA-98 / G3) TaxID=412133 RepID=A2DLR0_TRIV3|nr:hypothetical protein TVAGG3_0581130 [Trichomonas vaginalis G3]EAY18693.1 hypothetical protein TVAG_062980 [Trichomonas vaginalis G3]KAI5522592.1 hypothetical protein TVAGG3_0581130 [Trichomonas vaginalis G3]|eukprot:XP_001579679.1 hypothetical protein [Trichomonas vaginalis G3]